MDTQDFDIIIVGAGPTGLMLANQLTRFGADFLVLDKKAGPTVESRALVVQARSMEIYEQMGLSDTVVQDGQPAAGISLYKKGKRRASVNLKTMGQKASPFPYVMIYEQKDNEALLYGRLKSSGKQVTWNTEITDITERDGRYVLNNRYSCKYLVACDGIGSRVRAFSGMAFTGGTYENVFYVADTHARGVNLASDMMSLFLTKAEITFMFPMKGDHKFRVLGILPKEYYHREDIQFEEIVSHVKSNIQAPVEFYDTQWYSTYRLYCKKVDHFNKGNVFFAGDAAHVHSPAGGQGMNTGLQDAYNLAWKLALVSKGQAGASLLDTYHEERNPIAERLLRTTDRVFTIMTQSNNFFGFIKLFVVPKVVPLFNTFARMRKLWFGEVSQTKISYHASSLSGGVAGKIQAGSRFPYFFVEQDAGDISVFHWTRDQQKTPFLIILYRLGNPSFPGLDPALFSLASIADNPANSDTLKEIGFPASFMIVLRPDNYIGYISETADVHGMNSFMKSRYHLTGAV